MRITRVHSRRLLSSLHARVSNAPVKLGAYYRRDLKMKPLRTLRVASAAVMLLAIFLLQETWTLAGVTGNVTGIVRDSTGAPLAGVTVEAVAPSQKATTATDPAGHFVLLSLAPDTYTVSLTKAGYQTSSFPGVSVFADQTQQLTYTMTKALRVIARVTSQAGASLVKSGVGGDLYSINSAQAAAASALGGGGNLNSAYSAMASVPGIQVSQGGMGMSFNASYVRGRIFTTRDTNTMAFPSTAPSTTTTPRPNPPWACKSCKSTPAVVRRPSPRPVRPASSTRSSRRVPFPDSPPRISGSGRRNFTTKRRSRSADRRRIAPSAITSACWDTIKRSASLTTVSARAI